MELYKLLIKSDIDISSMNLEKASLENIYFDIVGREEKMIFGKLWITGTEDSPMIRIFCLPCLHTSAGNRVSSLLWYLLLCIRADPCR